MVEPDRKKPTAMASMEPQPSPAERLIERARQNMEDGLRSVLEAARKGDRASANKLRAFAFTKDPALATKLALMSNKQRRAYLAAQRQAAGRKKLRSEAKRAREQARGQRRNKEQRR